jgi:hypothetical protein
MTSLRARVRARLALVLLLALSPIVGRADSGTSCDQIRHSLRRKPERLEFVGCEQRTDRQGEPWVARYRVAGRYAADVERYLVDRRMAKRFRRTCCLWESVNNSYRDRDGRLFLISVSTDETTIDRRSRWARIPFFYVEVAQYAEDP